MTTDRETYETEPKATTLASKRTRYEMFRAAVVKQYHLFGKPENEIFRMVRNEINRLKLQKQGTR